MATWIETYRGTVPPWQCDLTEHFTVACYFDRLEEAEANLAEELGLGTLPNRGDLPRRIVGRFEREMRAGTGFHVESAVIDAGSGLRFGHRFVNSSTGETVTWFDSQWDLAAAPLAPEQRDAIVSRLADWNGPTLEERPEPTGTDGFIATARGRVKPADVNAGGHFALGAIVQRFSGASGQLSAAVGIDRAFMQRQRRGFSTFEQNLLLSGALRLDAPYLVETGIGHLGNSSLRMIHRMIDPRSGIEVARLSQYGVNLDLDTRRPARWPEEIRERAAALLVSMA
jgi:acyl-CoA thioesterase FadM